MAENHEKQVIDENTTTTPNKEIEIPSYMYRSNGTAEIKGGKQKPKEELKYIKTDENIGMGYLFKEIDNLIGAIVSNAKEPSCRIKINYTITADGSMRKEKIKGTIDTDGLPRIRG